jgi:flagellar biosynthesis component FlhA
MEVYAGSNLDFSIFPTVFAVTQCQRLACNAADCADAYVGP